MNTGPGLGDRWVLGLFYQISLSVINQICPLATAGTTIEAAITVPPAASLGATVRGDFKQAEGAGETGLSPGFTGRHHAAPEPGRHLCLAPGYRCRNADLA